jgi:hypothetical protein
VKITTIRKQKKPSMGFCSHETYGMEMRRARLGRDKKGAGHGRRGKYGEHETAPDR